MGLNKRSINIIRAHRLCDTKLIWDYLSANSARWWIIIFDNSVDPEEIAIEKSISPEEEMLLVFTGNYLANFKL